MTGHTIPGFDLPDFGGRQRCQWIDPDIFFPAGPGQETNRARQLEELCGPCPVRDACLEFAVNHSVEGVWAATTTAQRRTLRRQGQSDGRNAQQRRAQEHRRVVAELAGRGLTAQQIVARTGIHESSVWRALRELRSPAPAPTSQHVA